MSTVVVLTLLIIIISAILVVRFSDGLQKYRLRNPESIRNKVYDNTEAITYSKIVGKDAMKKTQPLTEPKNVEPDDLLYEKLFWGGWSREIHYLLPQRRMINKANEIDPDGPCINEDLRVGKFGKFETSLSSCSCKRFEKTQLPCHHIYFLAWDLGLPMADQFGEENEISKAELDKWLQINKNYIVNEFRSAQYPVEGNNWGNWSAFIHSLREQKERIIRASFNEKYETTLAYCSCPDFLFRRLPCKHIYAVAHQHNLLK